MPRKLVMAQAPFKILVANLQGGSDPSKGVSGNPVKVRKAFTLQHFPEKSGSIDVGTPSPEVPGLQTRVGLVAYTTPPLPVRASGVITVANNTFAGPTTIQIGPYVITSGIEFAIGGTTDLTAAAIEAAIDTLPGYSASVAASDVTVSGPFGVMGNEVSFFSGGANPQNFTFAPNTKTLGGAEPRIGPPLIE